METNAFMGILNTIMTVKLEVVLIPEMSCLGLAFTSTTVCAAITSRESVDSLCRDGADTPTKPM